MLKRMLILIIVLGIFVLGLAFFGQVSLSARSNLLNQNHSTPPSTYDPAPYGLPPTIAGYKTFAVLTADNTACMMPGEKRLVLQATQPDIESYLRASDHAAIVADLKQKGMGEYAQWGVQIVGPGTTLDQFLSENEKWNQQRKSGCVSHLPALTGSDYQEYKPRASNGYAMYEDTDASLYTNDNAQSVYLIAPATVPSKPKAVIFNNNVKTDSSTYYLLQNGMELWNGGKITWTDTTQGYVGKTYNIPYVASHTYWYTITYTNGVWWMCAKDNGDPSTYTCVSEPNGVGTTLGLDLGTSIFVENQNTDANWYDGFSSPLQAWGAKIYRNGVGQNWASNHRHTVDSCRAPWPPSSALSGSLTGGGTGDFILSGVPLVCPGAQAFATRGVSSVRGIRVNIWTAQQPSGYTYIASPVGICTNSGPTCSSTAGFFQTGYIKGTVTPVQNQLQQYASWANINGSVVNQYGLGNLSNNTWYSFKSLYSYTAQRWEAWQGSNVVWYVNGLNFTSGGMVSCGAEGSSNGVPLGVQCDSMQYKVGTESWTPYDYTGTQISGSYCVYRPYQYGAMGWGPC